MFNFYSTRRRSIERPRWFSLELKTLQIHLMVASKDVCVNDLMISMNCLVTEIEHSSDAAMFAVEPPHPEAVLDVVAMEGSEVEADHQHTSCL